MSIDLCPVLLTDAMTMSLPCENSLTDHQVRVAQAALRGLAPAWSLECCESCEADLFLDLSLVRRDGHCVSFIIHARGEAIDVLRMDGDDDSRLGSFDDMAQAVRGVAEAIAACVA